MAIQIQMAQIHQNKICSYTLLHRTKASLTSGAKNDVDVKIELPFDSLMLLVCTTVCFILNTRSDGNYQVMACTWVGKRLHFTLLEEGSVAYSYEGNHVLASFSTDENYEGINDGRLKKLKWTEHFTISNTTKLVTGSSWLP